MQDVSRGQAPGDTGHSGTGGHVGGEDVVRVAVQVLAGSVISHRRARVGVAGGDLDVPKVDAGIEHGRDERVPSFRTHRVQRFRVAIGPADSGDGVLRGWWILVVNSRHAGQRARRGP